MQSHHWEQLPPCAHFFVDRDKQPPAPSHAFHTENRGLLWWVPRAASAHHHAIGLFETGTISQGYRCQEKLNGAFVCWDGKSLWSKTGGHIQPPDTFLSLLPPGFPIVGELYVGNGYRERSMATTLAQNKLPSQETLGVNAAGADRRASWKHARIVAFDIPGVVNEWPYAARYETITILKQDRHRC